jgi:Lrp/AsnC family transcriptional regulator for asnA, asnC and gidA
VSLDSIDRQLIASLKIDGRMSYAELATRLSVSEGTARNRLGRLVQSGALRIMPVVEPDKIG